MVAPLVNAKLTSNPPVDFVPAPVVRISDVETLRVLADPLRLRILETFDTHPGQALTVKTIAAGLGEPVTKLYYHVNLLEEHGLLVVVEKRLVSGIVEKRYRLAAETIEVDRGLIGSSAPGMAPDVQAILDAIFGASRRSLELALGSGEARFIRDDAAPGRVVLVRTTELMTPAAAAEARRLIARLIEEIHDLATPTDPNQGVAGWPDPASPDDPRPFGLLIAFHPIAAGVVDTSAAGSSRGGTS